MARLRCVYKSVFMAVALGSLAATAQTTPVEASPVVLNGKAASALLVNQVRPDYPPVAKVNYIQGQVRLQLLVSRDGRVSDAHVVRGHPFLAAAALKVIRRWAYRPFVTGLGPQPFRTFVEVNFLLRPRRIDQLPTKPERDLTRQIRPPEVIDKPFRNPGVASVRLRILVSDKGRAIDSLLVAGLPDTSRWRARPSRRGRSGRRVGDLCLYRGIWTWTCPSKSRSSHRPQAIRAGNKLQFARNGWRSKSFNPEPVRMAWRRMFAGKSRRFSKQLESGRKGKDDAKMDGAPDGANYRGRHDLRPRVASKPAIQIYRRDGKHKGHLHRKS